MAGIEDNIAIIGDWVPPSPSPRTFFTAMLGEDMSSKFMSEALPDNKTEGLFLGSREQMRSGETHKKSLREMGDQSAELGLISEQKSSSRGGLGERIAARAGFNAPKLNTENIRSADLSSNPDVRSPYLTIPAGLSPTTLLDSPVFLSNSLVSLIICCL